MVQAWYTIAQGDTFIDLQAIFATPSREVNCHEAIVKDPHLCNVRKTSLVGEAFDRCTPEEAAHMSNSHDLVGCIGLPLLADIAGVLHDAACPRVPGMASACR